MQRSIDDNVEEMKLETRNETVPCHWCELRQCKGEVARWRLSRAAAHQSHTPAGVVQGNPNGFLQLKHPARQNPHDVTTNDRPSRNRKSYLCLHFITAHTYIYGSQDADIVTACSSTMSSQIKPLATSQAPPRPSQELFSCLEFGSTQRNVF
jgi:hypothetical protein